MESKCSRGGPMDADVSGLTTKLRALGQSPWLEMTERISEFYWLLKTQYYYRHFFGRIGSKSKLILPMRLRNVGNIHIGDGVLINKFAFLLTLQLEEELRPSLSIGDGSVIGHMNHITCVREVWIGKNVLTADLVYISDHSHEFSDIGRPILSQSVVSKGRVTIGDGSWIGENVAILSCNI